jgi:hypothetical protein
MVMLHNGADHTTIAIHDQPARKPLSRSVNRVNSFIARRQNDLVAVGHRIAWVHRKL